MLQFHMTCPCEAWDRRPARARTLGVANRMASSGYDPVTCACYLHILVHSHLHSGCRICCSWLYLAFAARTGYLLETKRAGCRNSCLEEIEVGLRGGSCSGGSSLLLNRYLMTGCISHELGSKNVISHTVTTYLLDTAICAGSHRQWRPQSYGSYRGAAPTGSWSGLTCPGPLHVVNKTSPI